MSIILRVLLFVLCFFLTSLSVFANVYKSFDHVTVLRVISGDRIKLRVKIWPGGIEQETIVHLNAVDAPDTKAVAENNRVTKYCERRTGNKAVNFVVSFLRSGKVRLVEVESGSSFYSVRGDLIVKDKSLSRALLDYKLALPLRNGEKSRVWKCGQQE